MVVICGFIWKTKRATHAHECVVVQHCDEGRGERHVCGCHEWIDCHDAARQDELRKEADANFGYYNGENQR